jgi:hypothetical protein
MLSWLEFDTPVGAVEVPLLEVELELLLPPHPATAIATLAARRTPVRRLL